jgi:hypothetical protein
MLGTSSTGWRRKCAIFLFTIVFATGLWAQGAGDLTGVVTDPTAAVVANAQVTLTNDATGIVRTAETTAGGVYRFSALPVVGTYTLSIEIPNYRPVTVSGVVISVGTTVTRDVKLEVGTKTETVTVEAGAETVQTADSQISTLINNRVWEQLPLSVRNQNEFINLVPGAVNQEVTGTNRGAAVNGARAGTGNYLVEGADNNDQGQGGRGQISDAKGGAVLGISPEAIEEYRVITNSFSAEYGKAAGFVTDTVLKSGTNKYHGSLFEYNRVQALAANDFFSNRGGTKDSLVRNQFGGSVGGPIVKDKTFFYTSLEFNRRRQSAPITTTGTTQEFLNWVDSGGFASWMETAPGGFCMKNIGETCPGAFANSSHLGPIFKQLAAKGPFPLSTRPSGYDPQGGGYTAYGAFTNVDNLGLAQLYYPVAPYGDITVNDPYRLNENRWSLKIDHKFNDKDSISGTYLFQTGSIYDQYGGGDNSVGPSYNQDGKNQNLVLTWNHTFTPNVLNVFKASYLRHVQNVLDAPGYENTPDIYTAFDPISVGFGNSSGEPQLFTDNLFQYQDHLSFVKGKHSFKTGAEFRRIRNGSSFFSYKNGEFLPYDVENMVTDGMFGEDTGVGIGGFYRAIASINPVTGQLPNYYRGFRANEVAAYFQDDYRVNNRLTLNVGVRWEYFGPPHNFQENVDSNFYFGAPTTPLANPGNNVFFPANSQMAANVASGTFQIRNHDIWQKDLNNFAPRLGFAYDVFGNQKFVVRGGYAIAYDRIYNNLFENIRFNPPYFSANTVGYFLNGVAVGPVSSPGLYTYPFTSTTEFNNPDYAPTPAPRHMDQNLVSPYYEQVHFGTQFEFAHGYVLESNYIGTWGKKLTGIMDINTFDGRVACSQQDEASARARCINAANAGLIPNFYLDPTRPNSSIANDNFRSNAFGSNYNALEVSVRKSFSKGLQFQSSYTWSKSLDTISDAFNSKGGGNPTDNMNVRLDYGPSDFDVRHIWVSDFSYDLPFFKANRWLGGWSTNSIIRMQTGSPFSPYSTTDLNRDGYQTDRINTVGVAPSSTVSSQSAADGYLNRADWAIPSCPMSVNDGLWCNAGLGRNYLHGPGLFNVDFGIVKKFKVTEGTSFSFMANFFNIFNRANFANPVSNLSDANFGKSLATATNPRETQLALRFDF